MNHDEQQLDDVEVGGRIRLTVERVAPGGHCVAHHAGRVVFVRHTLPGEVVTGQVTEVRPGYLRADAVEVHDAAPDRVTPPCRYAGPGGCGGCDWQHVTPAAQRLLKAATVTELLTRLGGLSDAEITALGVTVAELPGGPLDWRSRVRYAVDGTGRPGFRAHRSHRVIPVDDCPIATPAVRDLPVTDRRWPAGAEITAVATADGGAAVLSELPTPARRARGAKQSGRPRLAAGSLELVESALGRDFAVPAEAFWQVHPAAPDNLVGAAAGLLAVRPGERVLDLYGGVGLFTAALADAVGPTGAVTMVESGRAAVRAAARNLADLPRVTTVTARVEDVVTDLVAADRIDAVLLDPPRAGAGRAVVAALVEAGPRAICYVACDAAALARDTRTFGEAGWRLAALRCYDAFPMTQHVECVALFQPAGAVG